MFSSSSPTQTPDTVPLEQESISNSQEGNPVPQLHGTGYVAVRWITSILDQEAVQADDTASGKK
jgi:hypothetical protein